MADDLEESGSLVPLHADSSRWQKAREALGKFGKLGRSKQETITTPKKETKLPSALFALNQEADQKAKTEVINPEGVRRGAAEAHLIDANEQVMSFGGTLEQMAVLVQEAQDQPVRQVDQTPIEFQKAIQLDGGGYPVLRRTGIELVRNYSSAENTPYHQPADPSSVQVTAEVVGMFPVKGGYRVFLMYPPTRDYSLPQPRDYPDSSGGRQRESERLLQAHENQTSYLDRALGNPNVAGKKTEIEEALKNGAIVSEPRSAVIRGGYFTGGDNYRLQVEDRRPTADQKLRTEYNSDVVEIPVVTADSVGDYFKRVVVPAQALSTK